MPFRIETQYKVKDARSVSKRAFFNALIGQGKVAKTKIVDAYTVDARMSAKQMEQAAELLTNPLIERYQIIHPLLTSPLKGEENKKFPSLEGRDKGGVIFDYAFEISFLPGVTDNIGHTAKETIADGTGYKFKDGEDVYSSQVYFIKFKNIPPLKIRGGLGGDIKKITESLHNPLIQKAIIFPFPHNFPPNLPKVKLKSSSKITKVDLNVSDKELVKLGKLGILNSDGTRRGPLALKLDYLKVIRNYFNRLGRKPTDVELEMLAQTWSEHCKHIIMNSPIDNIKEGLFKRYIKGATEAIRQQKRGRSSGLPRRPSSGDFCVSVFKDNSGAVVFDKDFLITHKVETHNTPSALDPFGGSITGITGVNRDCLGFGLGAKPIINTYGFCLAEPDDKTALYRDAEKQHKMLSARRIMDGVVAGINAGGNQSGIPTNSGFLFFDKKYRGKPLVFAGTVGLIPRKIKGRLSHIKQAKPEDYIVMAGGKVGLDGIHGATFSSESLDAHSPATAVQIGDPITQKKFSDCLSKEAREAGLYNSITDCGAGGLSSAVGEMAQQSNGCEVNLDKVPAKYPGLAPWQIWISESQERMVLAVPPKHFREFEKLMKKRGVESSVIGKFTASGKCAVKFGKQTVMDIDLDFLHNGRPIRQQNSKPQIASTKEILTPKFKIKNLKLKILDLLASPNIASTAFLATQYDHEVQGGSVLKPLQGKGRVNADATITRPILDSKKGIALSSALYPEYSKVDAYYAAALAVDAAIRQAVCAGANPDTIALLDNFCWCSPEDPRRMWQLKQTAKACFDYAVSYGTPFISGKDSMYNDFKGFSDDGKPIKISIPPTLLISAIGVVDDVRKSISIDAKISGDVVYAIGEATNFPSPRHGEGAPKGREGLILKKIDATKNLSLYRAFYDCAQKNLIASAISAGRGGLAVALCKMAIAGQLGIEIKLPSPRNGEGQGERLINRWIFDAMPGAILATVDPKKSAQFESLMSGQPLLKIGKILKQPVISLALSGKPAVRIPLSQATKAYHSIFKHY